MATATAAKWNRNAGPHDIDGSLMLFFKLTFTGS